MRKGISTWLTAILLVASVGFAAEKSDSEKRLDEIRGRRLEIIERYGRAKALAEALSTMNQAEAELRKLDAEEKTILEKQTRELEEKNPGPRNKPHTPPMPKDGDRGD